MSHPVHPSPTLFSMAENLRFTEARFPLVIPPERFLSPQLLPPGIATTAGCRGRRTAWRPPSVCRASQPLPTSPRTCFLGQLSAIPPHATKRSARAEVHQGMIRIHGDRIRETQPEKSARD